MDFHYKDIIPWGRSFDEYLDMFDLSEDDLARDIVGVGDGPASFNALLLMSIATLPLSYHLLLTNFKKMELLARLNAFRITSRKQGMRC